MSKLSVEKLSKHFGGLQALLNVSLDIQEGERHALIGPNGAGKSTLFNLISGQLPPSAGRIFLDGREVTRLPVQQRANLGMGHTFQRSNLFMGLTALENVRLAVQHHEGLTRHWFKPIGAFPALTDTAIELLERVGLGPQKDVRAADLAYGQQRALEIGVALATRPSLLLMDEPTAGMSPAETQEMTRLIQNLPRSLTLIIIEHDMDVIFTLADRITVLHYGRVIHSGPPDEVRRDPQVQRIYLGTG